MRKIKIAFTTRLQEYLLAPRYHFSRFQFNFVTLFFVGTGFILGAYLAVNQIFFASATNDTIKTWTIDTANQAQFTRDSELVTIGNSGAYPVVNKLTNSTFDTDLTGWSGALSYTLNDQFDTATPVTLVSGLGTLTNSGVISPTTSGGELWDAPAAVFTSGTYAWTRYGANTITNDSNTLQTTYVDTANGAYDYLRDAYDLSATMAQLTWYQLSFDTKVSAGASVDWVLGNSYFNNGEYTFKSVTSTTFSPESIVFRSHPTASINNTYLRSGNLQSGESIWIDNISLKPLTVASMLSTVNTSTSNAMVSTGLTLASGAQAGVVLNVDSDTNPQNFVLAYHDGTNIRMDKRVGGTYTNLLSVASTYVAGATLRLERTGGNNYMVFYNGALVGTAQNIADAGIINNTRHGIFASSTGNTFASFAISTTVNGSAADPTGGTRYAYDNSGKLSAPSGAAFFNGGATSPGWGNPALYYPAITRAAGKLLSYKLNFSAFGGNGSMFGFETDYQPHFGSNAWTIYGGGGFMLWENGGYGPTLTNLSTSTDYQIAHVLRGTGVYHFIRGGTFTDWTLLWISKNQSNATLYPGFSNERNTFTLDNVRIPATTWLPTPLAYDTFTRTDGSAGNSEITGPDGQSAASNAWTGGTISSNKLVVVPTQGSELVTNGDFSSNTAGWVGTSATLSSVSDGGPSGNSLCVVNTGSSGSADQTLVSSMGWYALDFYQRSGGCGGVYADSRFGVVGGGPTYSVASGTWARRQYSFRGSITSLWMNTWGNAGAASAFDSVSIKPLTLSSLFSTINTSDNNVIADVDVTLTSGNNAGLVLNLDSATTPLNFVVAYHDGTNVKLEKSVGGTYTSLINTAVTYSAGATLRVIKDGTKYTVYYNGSPVGSTQTISDAGIISNTRHGVFSTFASNSFDNFTLWPRGSSTTKFTDAPFDELTVTRDTGTKYAGASSSKLVAAGVNGKYVQSLTTGTGDFAALGYVYTTGAAVTSADVEFYWDTSTIATTFTSVGGGWYKMTGSLTGSASAKDFGVKVKAGKTVYFDEPKLYKTGTFSLTTDMYTNNIVSSWDTFCEGTLVAEVCTPDATQSGNGSIKYQISVDNGVTWQYYSGGTWQSASNATTHVNTAAELTMAAMQAISVAEKQLTVKAIFFTDGVDIPVLPHIAVGLTTDITPPDVNASATAMKRVGGGTDVEPNGWTKELAPYFSWTAGADVAGGVGIRGYCLYLGTDSAGNPATAKGLLGTSPASTANTTCQFIVTSTNIDFSNLTYRGDTWLTTSTNPYYLNIKAIDAAGNVFAGASEQFQFRYDNTIPTNVAYIMPAGGNFSNVIDMNFAWPTTGPSTSSDTHAQVFGWQYQINSTTGTWLGTQYDAGLNANYIPLSDSSYTLTLDQDGASIVSGDNIVYFRTIDTAGNVSSDATIRTGSIKYGGAAPNFGGSDVVTVTPDTATTNSFALSWPAATPAAERTVTNYYYMVNTAPPSTLATLQNNASTYMNNGTNLSVSAAALPNVNKGNNTVYVVAIDDGTPANYSPSNFITGTFALNSTDPDNVGNLTASDSSIKLESKWMVTLTWTEPAYQGAGNLTYLVYRSANAVDYTQVGTTTGLSYVDSTPASQEYLYKIVTKDGANAVSSGTNAVSVFPTGKWTVPPTLESGPEIVSVTTRRATIAWSTNRGADSKVQFGTTTGIYGDVEPSNSDQVTAHSIQLSGLQPSTTYYNKAKWTDEDGNTGESDELSFTTAPAPIVKNVSVGSIGLSSALVKMTVSGASKVRVYYGQSIAFGGFQETATSLQETTYSILLSNLIDGTKYYYKINTFDTEAGEYDGTILDFSTLPRPEVSNVRVQQVANTAQTTLYVTWESNTAISSIVTYYPLNNSTATQNAVDVTLKKGEHAMVVKGLLPQTQYGLIVKGKDKIGNEAVSDVQTVTTATDTRPPKITDLVVEGSNIPAVSTTGQEQTAQLVISWNTDEPSTSQVEFGEGSGTQYTQLTQLDSNLTTNHLVIISNLSPSKVYHLRAISTDAAQNKSTSVDTVTITPKEADNALELVIINLQQAFGFLRN